MTGTPAPIRLLEHNLIDVCDLLDATFSLDRTRVAFVRRRAGGRDEWRGDLGDWLVPDGPGWRVVPDAEFGRTLAAGAESPAGHGAATDPARPLPSDQPAAGRDVLAS